MHCPKKMMDKWGAFRRWVNRDDGKVYQAGNRVLHPVEIAGYILLPIAMLSYLLTTKAGIDVSWIGWSCLATGCVIIIFDAAIRGEAAE